MAFLFGRKSVPTLPIPDSLKVATSVKPETEKSLLTVTQLSRVLRCGSRDISSGRHRVGLYRFLADNLPVVSACVSTWARLSSAPGDFYFEETTGTRDEKRALKCLADLSKRLYHGSRGNPGSLVTFLTDLFTGLFRDGVYGGFVVVKKDGSGVDDFISVDAADLSVTTENNRHRLSLELDDGRLDLNRSDFYYIPMNGDTCRPLGKSILQAVPFVAYIEQQLVDDMRRSSHNSGYHRLHVKVTPPERMAGEADEAYVDRINGYFDSTVSMIKSCQVDENPVTWDNVSIEYVGPDNVRAVTNSWFVNHRGMIEEICAGTNLAPFLLGYSYGATTTWSSFKFDLVMRQVKSVQSQVAAFLEWIGNIELALAGFDRRCRFKFDNNFAYQADERARVESTRVDSLLKLYQAGLIDRSSAREVARKLI
ncbi:MAG: hypothetical protein JSU74_09000 [Candidatus Zixiibacteriota bacterium]|nr:MAG: hypothetical protein JSU74_09000 [candidate division Zixibacteria bacterium]